jgi:hypothetical protein
VPDQKSVALFSQASSRLEAMVDVSVDSGMGFSFYRQN